MLSLKRQVLFSSTYFSKQDNWWTLAKELSPNLFALIFWSNCSQNETSQFLHHLKKQIAKTSENTTLPSLKSIINNSEISPNPHLSILLISFSTQNNQTKIHLFGKGNFVAKLIRNHKTINLPLKSAGLSGIVRENDLLVFSNLATFSQFASLNLPLLQKLTKTQLEIFSQNKNPVNFLSLELKPAFKFPFPKFPKLNFSFLQKIKKDPESFHPKLKPHHFSLPHFNLNLQEKRTPLLSQKRFYALIIASIFLLLLGFSIGFGSYKKQKLEAEQTQNNLIENITYKLNQAQSLKNLNPNRSKTLLKEAKDILASYSQTHKVNNLELQNLTQKVNEAYAFVTQKYLIKDPEVFFDLNLAKKDFSPSLFTLSENELTLFDEDQKTLIDLNIQNKSAQVIGGQDFINNETFLASIENWIFLSSQNTLQIVDKKTQKQIDSFRLEKIQIDSLLGYASNLYILDKKLNQVWRLRGLEKTLQKPDEFFQLPQDLKDVVSFSLDGSLWLLYLDGGLEKYTSGVKDAYYPPYTLNLDEPLKNPQKIYTDEYCQNLYILDKANNRIVVFSKLGQYQGQYIWDGIKNLSDFTVSENIGKILLLIDDKIYGLNIQK